MAAFLTDDESRALAWVEAYLAGNYEKPLDDAAVGKLAVFASRLGVGEVRFREMMRDAPTVTLLMVFEAIDRV